MLLPSTGQRMTSARRALLSWFILTIMLDRIGICQYPIYEFTLDVNFSLTARLAESNIKVRMEVEFADADLEKLATDPTFTMGLSRAIVKAFRKRVQSILSAHDERDFYDNKSLHFEKLKGKRQGEHSMKLNDQFRLIVKYQATGTTKRLVLVAIEDYH